MPNFMAYENEDLLRISAFGLRIFKVADVQRARFVFLNSYFAGGAVRTSAGVARNGKYLPNNRKWP